MLLNNRLYFRVFLQPLEYVLIWLSTGNLSETAGSGRTTLLLPDQGFQGHQTAASPRLSSFRILALLQPAWDIVTRVIGSCSGSVLCQTYHLLLSRVICCLSLRLLLWIWALLTYIGHLSHWPLFIKVIVYRKLIHDVFALRYRCILRLKGIEYPGNKTRDIFFLVLEKLKQRLNNLCSCLIFVDC
jgi:hypothetical protein